MLELSALPKKKQRTYKSVARHRQAAETRRRIVAAAHRLLRHEGFSGMTIDAIAKKANVSVPTVYAIFKSKTGILTALLDESRFGSEYEGIVRYAQSTTDPETRLRRAAAVARQIRSAQSAVFELMRGAGVVAPELAKLERQRERLRYEREESVISSLHGSGKLRPILHYQIARDIFWMLTGGDVYRMLVRERGWAPEQYESWLADTLVKLLLAESN
jgi:TetR/AcrR family transcriptional regulator, regulator of cefoperazone and chloramphenicol sensitivity